MCVSMCKCNIFNFKIDYDQHVLCVQIIVLTFTYFLLSDAIDSSQCQKAIHPFLCQYLFPLCGQRNYLPSKEECFYVSTVACEKEYDFVRKYVPKISLPNCEYLPSETYPKSKFD